MKLKVLYSVLIACSLSSCNKQNFQVITEPTGAVIYDKAKRQNIGVTPFRQNLPDGQYSLSISKDNFAEELITFQVKNSVNSMTQPIIVKFKTYLEKRLDAKYWENKIFIESDTQLSGYTTPIIFKSNGLLYQISLKTGHLLGKPEKWYIQDDKLFIVRSYGKTLAFPLHNEKKEVFKAQRNLGFGVVYYTTISAK